MYINAMSSDLTGSFERILLGTSERAARKTTNFGEYNGVRIKVDSYFNGAGKKVQKKYTFWTDIVELIYYKNVNKEGRFDLLV